ncbi:MAG: protoheme IX farnesyltransferase [Actinomycetales bacterium]|nr:protoheme IX farnesyltransferase [Actinomycetales bacterium]
MAGPRSSGTGGRSAASAPPGALGRTGTVRAYVSLTKPRIIELLLVTTVPTMVLAEGGFPDPLLVLATLVGGALAAGSANTLNCYLDRDIDVLMRRTARRPLATGRISERGALVFGLALGVVSLVILWFGANPLAAGLTLAAILLYVLLYTLLLKRRTSQNIVWGGAAGCMPVLIGWSAVTGRLDWAPAVLFGVIFLWTPAHYWPLSVRFREDYAAAGVPMLPVVAGPRLVARRVLAFTWATVACSLVLVPVAPTGPFYAVVATGLGAHFLVEAYRLRGRAERGERELRAMRVFHASITYLSLLFVAVAVDPFLRF